MRADIGAEPVSPGLHEVLYSGNPIPPVSFRSAVEVPIGLSDYDLQTNGSNCARISKTADGQVMAVWTQGFEETAYPDRGTGYNLFDGAQWGAQPTARLEAGVRTGWPNHMVTASGKEFIVSHVFTAGEYRLHYLRRNNTGEAWTEGDTPTDIPSGSLWPKGTVGGPDGESVHLISITGDAATGTGSYLGVNGHIVYHRSLDGGATWDIVDGIIPGLDSTLMGFTLTDAYTIAARGETVVIGVFSGFSDTKIFKSTDNGDTWESFRLRDFPIDGYIRDSGYDPATLPPDRDTLATQPYAIFTSDGSGAIVIDHDNKVHAFFGDMFVSDEDLTDGNTTYYRFTSGMNYWNESFGEDSTRFIADVLDLNGNDTIDVDDAGIYNGGMTSHVSAGIDAAGNLFIAYSALVEGEDFANMEDGQNYRHVYLVASDDGGETWTDPYDAINPDVVIEPSLVNFIEAVYPTMVADVGENVEFIYQSDFRPGTVIGTDGDPVEGVFINYVSIPVTDLITVGEKVVQPAFFQLEVQPNPASNEAWVSFDLERNARYALSLHNMMGQKVADVDMDNAFGSSIQRIDLAGLQAGLYLVRLQAENKVAVAKLMVR
ncbi:MAG: T9SS type A sorting domain-containing protein [Phaeodactylibacter sp.]|nr:T9SS type A sorting domain-containing protein [Phaeodactylibacter sp.]MCB9292381.1 T9SS type A sorting domain-containing protein [Lewinellaceae bacterium]